MKRLWFIFILIFILLISTACGIEQSVQAGAPAPEVVSEPIAEVTPAVEVASPAQASEEAALIWEGDPLAEDGQVECATLRLAAEEAASLGPCGSAAQAVELLAAHQTTWAAISTRFAPFEAETEAGHLVFQGQGTEASPAWQNAIAIWARFTYLELSSGRVGAANRTVMSWWLGELPGQPGFCRQLVVLNYGYAYTNITPCEGGQVKETTGGWLETAEWEQFDTWLKVQAPLYQENNYFSGLGTKEMSEAEAAALAAWAEAVYTRLQSKD